MVDDLPPIPAFMERRPWRLAELAAASALTADDRALFTDLPFLPPADAPAEPHAAGMPQSETPMDDQTDEVAVQAEKLMGEVRDALLTHIRDMKNPWPKLSENEQRQKVEAITRTARHCVTRSIGIAAKRGFDAIAVSVSDFTVKDGGIKLKATAHGSVENIALLASHPGAAALVLVDAETFMGAEDVAVDLDAPELPIDDVVVDEDDDMPAAPAMPS